jgi:hypothetical protein
MTFTDWLIEKEFYVLHPTDGKIPFVSKSKKLNRGLYGTEFKSQEDKLVITEEYSNRSDTVVPCYDLVSKLDKVSLQHVRHFGARQSYTSTVLMLYSLYEVAKNNMDVIYVSTNPEYQLEVFQSILHCSDYNDKYNNNKGMMVGNTNVVFNTGSVLFRKRINWNMIDNAISEQTARFVIIYDNALHYNEYWGDLEYNFDVNRIVENITA